MTSLRIAIIGGGFTGAAFAIHAARAFPGALEFHLVEPSADIGRGIAYGATDPMHRINVPSGKMSLFPQDRDHATRWFFEQGVLPGNGTAGDADGNYYVPRWSYGSYVGDVLRATLREVGPRLALFHHRSHAQDVSRQGEAWSIRLRDGSALQTDLVMLSLGHAAPRPSFAISAAARDRPDLVLDPWRKDALAALDRSNTVLLVGTGLTMADMVETLVSAGQSAPMTAVSRHALLALPHGQFREDIDFLGDDLLPPTAIALLRLARRRTRQAMSQRLGWQPVTDALRFQLKRLWPALPKGERLMIIRRLLPFWEVHRFRVAPQPHATVSRALASGLLTVEKAGVIAVDAAHGSLVATLRRHGGSVEARRFGSIVLCTGPDRDLSRNPLVGNLVLSGLARLDEVGLGLDVDGDCRVIDGNGRTSATLRALGPMTRGTFGEMTGAPDITRHVVELVGRMREEFFADGRPVAERIRTDLRACERFGSREGEIRAFLKVSGKGSNHCGSFVWWSPAAWGQIAFGAAPGNRGNRSSDELYRCIWRQDEPRRTPAVRQSRGPACQS
jgi:uncharacterized NAD(P)/FAD-binding protein YdhS